jgi:hypothetical protein
MRGKSTSKLVWSRGTDGPAIVPTEKYNWDLHNSRKIQSSMEISLKLFEETTNKQSKARVDELIGPLDS